jgi:hypothetical protein
MGIEALTILLYVTLTAAGINGLIMMGQIQKMREFNHKAETLKELVRKAGLRRRK